MARTKVVRIWSYLYDKLEANAEEVDGQTVGSLLNVLLDNHLNGVNTTTKLVPSAAGRSLENTKKTPNKNKPIKKDILLKLRVFNPDTIEWHWINENSPVEEKTSFFDKIADLVTAAIRIGDRSAMLRDMCYIVVPRGTEHTAEELDVIDGKSEDVWRLWYQWCEERDAVPASHRSAKFNMVGRDELKKDVEKMLKFKKKEAQNG